MHRNDRSLKRLSVSALLFVHLIRLTLFVMCLHLSERDLSVSVLHKRTLAEGLDLADAPHIPNLFIIRLLELEIKVTELAACMTAMISILKRQRR